MTAAACCVARTTRKMMDDDERREERRGDHRGGDGEDDDDASSMSSNYDDQEEEGGGGDGGVVEKDAEEDEEEVSRSNHHRHDRDHSNSNDEHHNSHSYSHAYDDSAVSLDLLAVADVLGGQGGGGGGDDAGEGGNSKNQRQREQQQQQREQQQEQQQDSDQSITLLLSPEPKTPTRRRVGGVKSSDDVFFGGAGRAAYNCGYHDNDDTENVDDDERMDAVPLAMPTFATSISARFSPVGGTVGGKTFQSSSSSSPYSSPRSRSFSASFSSLSSFSSPMRAMGTTTSSSASPHVSSIRSLHALLATNRNKKVRDEFQEFVERASGSISQFCFDVNDAQSGKTFDECYEKGRVLGEGGFATVFTCRHRENEMSYAVKEVIREEYEGEMNLREEIASLKKFRDSVYAVRLLDVFVEPKRTLMVMEECSGGDLLDKIQEIEFYPESDARKVCRTLIEAIRCFHRRRVAHRDIKPENILLVHRDDNTTIKVCDFGCAKQIPDGDKTLKTLCGSPEYCSPEVYLREGYNEMCDLWSAGVVMFVVLGGYVPFEAPNAKELPELICSGYYEYDPEYWDEISQDAKDCIDMLLKVDPDDRATAERCLKCQWLRRGDAQLVEEGSIRSFNVSMNASQHFNVDLRPITGGNEVDGDDSDLHAEKTKRGKLVREKNNTDDKTRMVGLPRDSKHPDEEKKKEYDLDDDSDCDSDDSVESTSSYEYIVPFEEKKPIAAPIAGKKNTSSLLSDSDSDSDVSDSSVSSTDG